MFGKTNFIYKPIKKQGRAALELLVKSTANLFYNQSSNGFVILFFVAKAKQSSIFFVKGTFINDVRV
jgi:hypothetical protein